ncbi:hypothetical protein JFL47_11390 [Haemophilus haemoglobinophilus]|nr:hypothetical protein [Canicola haemoglobinophilus]MBN6711817.1 hypothetical protein [Canicola haemoglobinophilus]
MCLCSNKGFKSLIFLALLFVGHNVSADTSTGVVGIYETVIENRYIDLGYSPTKSKELASKLTKLSLKSVPLSKSFNVIGVASWYGSIFELLTYAPSLNSNEFEIVDFIRNDTRSRNYYSNGTIEDASLNNILDMKFSSVYEDTLVVTKKPIIKGIFITLPPEWGEYVVAVQPLSFASSGLFIYRSLFPVDKQGNYCYAQSIMGIRSCEIVYSGKYNNEEIVERRKLSFSPDLELVGNMPENNIFEFTREYTRYIDSGDKYSNSAIEDQVFINKKFGGDGSNDNSYISGNIVFLKKHWVLSEDEIIMSERTWATEESGSYNLEDIYYFPDDMYGELTLELINIPHTLIRVFKSIDEDSFDWLVPDVGPFDDSMFNELMKEKQKYNALNNFSDLAKPENKQISENNYISDKDMAAFVNNSYNNYALKANNLDIPPPITPSTPITADEFKRARNQLGYNSSRGTPLSETLSSPSTDLENFYNPKTTSIEADTQPDTALPPQPIAPPTNFPISGGGALPAGASGSSIGNSTVSGNSLAGDKAGTVTTAGTSTTTAEATEDKVDEKENNFLVPEGVTALEILQPLLDIKDNLQHLKNISGSGTCPTYDLNLFGEGFTLDSHCLILDKVGHIFQSVAMLMWSILGLIIILRA